jgi:Ni/Co efflux regulator RcnB
MKRLLITATALSILVGPAAAFAQDHHDEHGGGRPGGGAPHAAPQAPPQAPRGPQPGGGFRPQMQQAPQAQPQYRGPSQYQGQGQYQGQYQGRPQPQQFPGGQGGYRPQPGGQFPGGQYHGGQGGYQGGYRPQPGQQGGQFQRYNGGGQAFSYGGRSFMRYRAEPYRYPAQYGGWAHHYWQRGEWLPAAFISPYYFIDDFYAYDLWQPDYGFQWIRVGSDAVLVNLASGQVVDVVPGVYYY